MRAQQVIVVKRRCTALRNLCTICINVSQKELSRRFLQLSRRFNVTVSHLPRWSSTSHSAQNVQSICDLWTARFSDKNISEPRISSELIVAHVLGKKTLAGVAGWQILSDEKTDQINGLCELRLKNKMPVQYVIEEWDFCDLTLQMKPPVLIPRPETENLVGYIQEHYKDELNRPLKILDIGCGSGAIILALAKHFPLASCSAIDNNVVACELTAKNANNYSLQVQVEHLEFSEHSVKNSDFMRGKYDIIVSNPPYIKSEELKDLSEEISRHEDVDGALHGGKDGLSLTKVILGSISELMHERSTLWLEVGPDHPAQIEALVRQHERHWNISLKKTFPDFLGVFRFCLFSMNFWSHNQ